MTWKTSKPLRYLAVLFAVTLCALSAVAPLAAAESSQDEQLTGMISRNEAGRFVLIDEESGNSVVLDSAEPQQLADNENTRVVITGKWSATRETFIVSSLEPAPATAAEPTVQQ